MSAPTSSNGSHARFALWFCARFALLLLGIFAALGLLSLGSLWSLPGHEPVHRLALVLVMSMATLGAWIGWKESRLLTFWRRSSILLGLASFPVWKVWLRQGAQPSITLWVLALWLALSSGAEVAHLWRWKQACDGEQPVLAHPLFPVWTIVWMMLTLALLPYFGLVACASALAGQAFCWWLWTETSQVPRLWFVQLMAASVVGLGLVAGLFDLQLSQNEYWSVDQWKIKKKTFRIERLRKHPLMAVQGPGNAFYSTEAHRWAEALVHPTLSKLQGPARIWLLGGETGLALREILRYPHVSEVVVWTPRAARQQFFAQHPLLAPYHLHAFRDPRVRLRTFPSKLLMLQAIAAYKPAKPFSRILQLLDEPWRRDARAFYEAPHLGHLRRLLAKNGRLGVTMGLLQPTEELACLLRGLHRAGWKTLPYRAFGLDVTWGFALASREALDWKKLQLPSGLRYLSQQRLAHWFHFPVDQRAKLKSCPLSQR